MLISQRRLMLPTHPEMLGYLQLAMTSDDAHSTVLKVRYIGLLVERVVPQKLSPKSKVDNLLSRNQAAFRRSRSRHLCDQVAALITIVENDSADSGN